LKNVFLLILISTCITIDVAGQSPIFNSIYWGTYFNDDNHFPSFNYSETDLIDQVAVDGQSGSVYVVGQSFAPPLNSSIPVCSGAQSIDLGGGNGYLAKFNRCGDLIWSTYLGEKTLCLTLDYENGKTVIYVAGNIKEKGMPGQMAFSCDGSPAGVFQPANDNSSDAFVAKYEDQDSTVAMLRWTYLGGTKPDTVNGGETIYSIAVYNHHVYVVGSTTSTTLHAGALHMYDSTKSDGADDGFIAQLDSLLSKLEFFTYIGAEGVDRLHDIKVTGKGSSVRIYASGTTSSASDIAAGAGFDQAYESPDDGFLQRWDKKGNGVFTKTWGTYIGGNGDEHSRVANIDKDENIFLTGFTRSTNFPVSEHAHDTVFGDNGSSSKAADSYVIKINSAGGKEWSTYFGGNKDERASSLAIFRRQGIQYVAITGFTSADSSSFPLVSPIQTRLNGNSPITYSDAFVAILDDVPSGQQQHLTQSTYIGGSLSEGIQTGKSYHPFIAVGPDKEIYFVTATKSNDIDAVVGNEFQHLIQPYNGGSDAFVAKLIDSVNFNQKGCTFLAPQKISEPSSDNGFTAYPVPAGNQIMLRLRSENEGKVSAEIFNSLQQLVTSQQVTVEKGNNLIPLDLTQLSGGIYLVVIRNGNELMQTKIIKE
jgi:hypothetical protein